MQFRPAPPWIAAGAPIFEADLRGTGIMAAVPCYGGMLTTAALRGLLETQRAMISLGLPFAVATMTNESLITRARNALVARFLASDASHLLFVDSDIGFSADAVLRLLGHGRPVTGGLYRSKTTERHEWVATFPEPRVRRDETTGAVEVLAIGTGFLLIHRGVLLAMAEAHPQTLYRSEDGPVHALFATGVADGTYLSEDYHFCARWRAMGGEIWCDPAIRLEHHGQVSLVGDPMALFSPGFAP